MNGYDIRIIGLIFRICYYYIMSFLVAPIIFVSNIIDFIRVKLFNKKLVSKSDMTYQQLVLKRIEELHKLLMTMKYEDQKCNLQLESEIDKSLKNVLCSKCRCDSIFSNEDSYDSRSSKIIAEFTNSDKIYSLKVDTIGRYDLIKSDINDDSHIHINLKRKTIDIVGETGTNRLNLRPNQIIISAHDTYQNIKT